MLTPLVLLAILSVVGGWVGVPAALGGHNEFEHFLDPVFAATAAPAVAEASHTLELGLAAVSVLVALLGLFIAYVFYYKRPGTLGKLAATSKLYPIVANKFYVDELYGFLVTGLLAFTRLILEVFVDGGLVNGSGKLAGLTTMGLSNVTRKMQSGNIRSYAGWLAFGAACVIAVMIFAHF